MSAAIDIGAEERRADSRALAAATTADLAAARARDAETHSTVNAETRTGRELGVAQQGSFPSLGEIIAMAVGLGHAPPTGAARATLEMQWALSNRSAGANARVTAPELARRCKAAAGRTWMPDAAERDALAAALLERTLKRYCGGYDGDLPTSRQAGMHSLEREAVKLAQRAADRATRADRNTEDRAWRDVEDRSALRLDAPSRDADADAEPMGAVMPELAREDATFRRRIAGAETDALTADALELGPERVAWTAALNGWTDAELAGALGIKLAAAIKRRQRSADALRARWETPDALAAAWMEAERAVAVDGVDADAYCATSAATYSAARRAVEAADHAETHGNPRPVASPDGGERLVGSWAPMPCTVPPVGKRAPMAPMAYRRAGMSTLPS